MKFITLFFLLCLLTLFCYQTVSACRCFVSPPPCYAYSQYDAVFVGTVKKVEEDSETNNFSPKVVVEVEQDFKGNLEKNMFTYNNEAHSCALTFRKSDKFLFYGSLRENDKSIFGTGYCTRTQEFEDDLLDFDFLKSINDSKPNYWIWGTISKGLNDSAIKGIKAEVFDNKRKLIGISDKNGDLKITVSKEGTYKVRLFVPKDFELNISQYEEQRNIFKRVGVHKKQRCAEYEVEVKNNRCGWFDAALYELKD